MAAHAVPLRRSSRLKSEHGVPGASPGGEETTGGVKASGDSYQCRTSEKKVPLSFFDVLYFLSAVFWWAFLSIPVELACDEGQALFKCTGSSIFPFEGPH